MKRTPTLTTNRLLELRRQARRIGMFTSFGRGADNKELRCLAEKMATAIDRELMQGGESK